MAASRRAPAVEGLTGKEASNFRHLLVSYETKQYKRALKLADAILKKYKEHGETMAMKGLVLNAMKRKDEAMVLIRAGLRANIKSHVCWHVYGLFHRSGGDYAEAVKAYSQALRFDPENVQILRDQGFLQIQIRDIKGFIETQRRLLSIQGSNKAAWVGFAVGHHLAHNTNLAVEVLSQYQATLETGPQDASKKTYEINELVLYRSRILEEDEQYEAALDQLENGWSKLLNTDNGLERKASLLTKLGRFSEALPLWRQLLKKVNPENYNFHRGLLACFLERPDDVAMLCRIDTHSTGNVASTLSRSIYSSQTAARGTGVRRGVDLFVQDTSIVDSASIEKLIKLYDELAEESPRCRAHKRIPLTFLPASHEAFTARLDEYLKKYMSKGVYALVSDIKPMYQDKDKLAVLQQLLIDTYLANVVNDQKRQSAEGPKNVIDPCEQLMAYYMAANHYRRIGKLQDALSMIKAAIEHTPTAVELYVLHARIVKNLGDSKLAAEIMQTARELDLADRYMNTKCTKYLWRADMTKEASEVGSMFARHEGDPLVYLVDLQTIWFESEAAASFERQGDLGMALKRYHDAMKHFNDFKEDQFDFHQYCLRRTTLRSYIDFLSLEDTWRRHPYFIRATLGMARCWLALYKMPELCSAAKAEDLDYTAEELAAFPSSERKKIKQAMRKKEKNVTQSKEDENNSKKRIDVDPKGHKFLKVEKPLDKAFECAVELLTNAPDVPETYVIAAQVATLRQKPIQALKYASWLNQLRNSHWNRSLRDSAMNVLELVATCCDKALKDDSTASATKEYIKQHRNVVEDTTTALSALKL